MANNQDNKEKSGENQTSVSVEHESLNKLDASKSAGQSSGHGTAARKQPTGEARHDPDEFDDNEIGKGQTGQPGLEDPDKDEWNPSQGPSDS